MLVCLRTLQTSDAPLKPLNSGTSRRIAAPCSYAPSLRLAQTATCFPNAVERRPILIHTKSALCSSAPHGDCGCPRCPSYKHSCRCIALRRPNAIYARRARDLNKACLDTAPPRRKVEEAWNITKKYVAVRDNLKAPATESQVLTVSCIGNSVVDDDDEEDNALSNVFLV